MAWVLNKMEDLSYNEISEVMRVSVSSVESLLFRARKNLKKILSGMYPGE
jgi:RNA polymerase sigma-70 factor (ECF subfamily)